MHATGHPTTHRAALELQARARDHALEERVERLERRVAGLHARIDGALVTVVARAEHRDVDPEEPADDAS